MAGPTTKDPATVAKQIADDAAKNVAAKLPRAEQKDGISLLCNLPHGLLIAHKGRKLTVAGANHPQAIATGLAFSARWGATHDVDEEWFDDWVATHDPDVVRNGFIQKTTRAKAQDHAQAVGDAVETGTDQVDPADPGDGVEQRTDKD